MVVSVGVYRNVYWFIDAGEHFRDTLCFWMGVGIGAVGNGVGRMVYAIPKTLPGTL